MKSHQLLQPDTQQLLNLERLVKAGIFKWNQRTGEYLLSQGAAAAIGLGDEYVLPEKHFFDHFVDPADLESLKAQIEDAQENGADINTIFRINEPEAIDRHFQLISRIADQDDATDWRSAVLLDTTDQRKSENQLKLTVEELERSNKDLENFAYIASHDLQEPLRKIVAFGDLLESEIEKEDNEDVQLYFGKIRNAAERMQKLISDLLMYSRVSQLGLNFKKVDLNQVLENVLDGLSQSISESEAEIQVSKLPTIECHETRMFQLIQNLLSNAIKFRHKERKLRIEVSVKRITILTGEKNRERTRGIEISIKDNGIGFDEVYATKIFTIFQRLHNRQVYKGTGIGLALVKKIVDLHQGEVKAIGEPGLGATFKVRLPIKQAKAWKKTHKEIMQ